MKPDLNLLAVFDAVARTGSVTAAAVHLGLSQPAVSHALNRLRATVNDPLFTRSGRGLVPTPGALAMLEPARDLLAGATALLTPQKFRPETASDVFRLGASDYAVHTLVPDLVLRLRQAAPQATLQILPVGSQTLRQLESGGLDLSFWGTQAPDRPYHHRTVLQEHYLGVARRNHPIFASSPKGAVTLSHYLAYPHAVVSQRDPGTNEVDRALTNLGIVRQIGLISHSFTGNMASLRTSDLIANLPSRLCASSHLHGLQSFLLPFELPTYTYGLVWHQRTDAAAGHTWLRNLVADCAASPGEDG